MLKPRHIRALRTAAGMTQIEFARRIRVSPRTVIYWERGQANPLPGARVRMAAMARLFPHLNWPESYRDDD